MRNPSQTTEIPISHAMATTHRALIVDSGFTKLRRLGVSRPADVTWQKIMNKQHSGDDISIVVAIGLSSSGPIPREFLDWVQTSVDTPTSDIVVLTDPKVWRVKSYDILDLSIKQARKALLLNLHELSHQASGSPHSAGGCHKTNKRSRSAGTDKLFQLVAIKNHHGVQEENQHFDSDARRAVFHNLDGALKPSAPALILGDLGVTHSGLAQLLPSPHLDSIQSLSNYDRHVAALTWNASLVGACTPGPNTVVVKWHMETSNVDPPHFKKARTFTSSSSSSLSS